MTVHAAISGTPWGGISFNHVHREMNAEFGNSLTCRCTVEWGWKSVYEPETSI